MKVKMSKKCKRSVNDCKKSLNCMFFTRLMSKKKVYIYGSLVLITFFFWLISDSRANDGEFSERVKVSLREAGNQLLLANQDSTSLVLPIVELGKGKYELSFQDQLPMEPSHLVAILKESFQKSELPDDYRVEVVHCKDEEVAYSYEMSSNLENVIIPCIGRTMPISCYEIDVKFTKRTASFFSKQVFLYLLIFIVVIALLDFVLNTRKQEQPDSDEKEKYVIGSFYFFPEQNKLVKAAAEISLSKKECELLAIFVSNPNQIIKRDELTKKVWEDNGVFVGRSLDTYVSKLRKKLKGDDSIKLSNVHGVGYKLEIKD